MDPRPIGVFDSGIGGLMAVRMLRHLRRVSPSSTWGIPPGCPMATAGRGDRPADRRADRLAAAAECQGAYRGLRHHKLQCRRNTAAAAGSLL